MQQVIEGFDLSLQQARVWALQQEQDVYRGQCAIRIEGPVHLPTLRQAVQNVLTHNEVYRTSFRRMPGMKRPLQLVHASPLWLWQDVDLRDLSPGRQHEQQERLAQDTFSTPLDWVHGPLVVCTLLTLTHQDHLLLVHLSALLADAASLNLFFHQLIGSYQDPCPASTAEMEDLPYLQFAAMQTALLEKRDEQELRHQATWWGQTSAAFPILTLPFEHQIAQQSDFSPRAVTISLASENWGHLQAFLQQQSCSWPVFLLACWQLLLCRLTGRNDLLLGVEVDGRHYEDLAELSGLLTKEMPFLSYLRPDLSLAELLAQTQETHQDLLIQYLAFSWEDLERTAPLRYAWSFAFREHLQVAHSAGVSWALQRWHACCEPFKVKLIAVRTGDSLRIEMHYDGSRFEQCDIERLAKQFTSLLTQAAKQPEANLATLEMLSDGEREYLLVEWNQTQEAYPEEQYVHQLVENWVQRTPDAVAVISQQGQLTYQALDRRANQLAQALRSRGVQPEVLVGLCLPREPECLVAILGILKAGGAYLPLEADQPILRLAALVHEANLCLLLTTSALQHLMPPDLPLLLLDDFERTLEQYSAEAALPSQVGSQNLAYVLYTSGSTGTPKGVMISQQGLLHYVHWAAWRYEVAEGTGSPLHSRLSFDLTVTSLFAPLVVGRAVCLVSEEQGIQGLAETLLQSQDFSLVKLTPAHLEMLNQMLAKSELAGKTRTLVVGGEALRWESLALWRSHAPETRIINEYGPTETVVGCCVYEVQASGSASGAVPIGRPIANTQLYVLDTHLQPVPVGVTGEIFIGGIGVARGYLQRGDLTAERFLPNPWSAGPGTRLYRTGDLGRHRGDGELEYVGRTDSQVKVRGYRIELGEIEAVLAQHPRVQECLVQAQTGEGGEQDLVAYVLGVPGQSALEGGELRAYVGERLPQYMVPTSFAVLSFWPLTSNGKVDRQAFLAIGAKGDVGSEVEVVPRTGIQEVIAGLWCSVLDRAQVGLRENFFDLGGHSLLATRLVSRLKSVMGVEVPVHVVFDQPTVAELAQWIEQALRKNKGLEIPPIVAVARPKAIPLSFAQQRLRFLDQFEPASPTYLIPTAFRLLGTFDIQSWEESMRALIQRHESLRTTFEERAGEVVQVIHPESRLRVPVIDLQGIAQRSQKAQELTEQEAERPMNLSTGPLLRIAVVRLSPQQYVLLLTLHHIITDGWSMEVLVGELTALYQAHVAGEPCSLPALPLQYADYAIFQREWLQGEVLARQLAYWRTHLAGLSPLALPTDHPRPAIMTSNGARQSMLLPQALCEDLQRLSRQEGVTLFMLLLAAFQLLLARYSGEADIAVGTPIANRTQVEIERIIGFFVNTLVMRTDLSGNPSFQEVLRRVRKVALAAYTHQDIPFEKIVEELEPERDLSRSPLFQVMLVLQNVPQKRRELVGMNIESLGTESRVSKFDLTLMLTETGHGLHATLEYRTDLFEAETIGRMLTHFQTLLISVVQDPQARIFELPWLTSAERHQLLIEWNATTAERAPAATLLDVLEAQVEQTPDRVTLVFEDQQLSYATLDRRVNQLAHLLQAKGIGSDVLVGLCLPRCLEMVIGILGILKAGGAYVPLDPLLPGERFSFLLADTGLSLVLTKETLNISWDQLRINTEPLCLDRVWPTLLQQPERRPERRLDGEHLAYLIYTSGSTGLPKGVMITHANVLHSTLARHAFYPEAVGTYLLVSPISFDSSVAGLFWTLSQSGRLMVPGEDFAPEQEVLAEVIEQQGITHLLVVPSLYALVLEGGRPEQLRSLRQVIVAGESCPPMLVATHRKGVPQAQLANEYGPTEATVWSSAYQDEGQGLEGGFAIGGPRANVQFYLLDPALQPVPVGVVGELYIGGSGLARGYWRRPDLTAERFLANPWSRISGARLYRTGDLARYRAYGVIEYLGCADSQVKIRGFRIELGEVESVLRQHPGVQEAVVVVREEEEKRWGQEAIRTPLEEMLAGLWGEILGGIQVGREANFFELGGHSLLAMRLIVRLRAVFGVEVPLRAVFEAPTVLGLAERVEQALHVREGRALPPLRAEERPAHIPLSFAQQRLWFLDQFEPASTTYLLSSAFRVFGTFDMRNWEKGMRALIQRHESLRTTFEERAGEAVQVIHPAGRLFLPVIDLQGIGQGEQELQAQWLTEQEAQYPMDLATGPLLRTRLLRLSPKVHLLLLTLHHIITDGWSTEILIRELTTLYRAQVEGKPFSLPVLPLQYADYAIWQREFLQGEVLQEQVAYWKKQLWRAKPLALPTDALPADPDDHAEAYAVSFPMKLSAELVSLSRKSGVTLFMLLLAAFHVLLYRWTGETDIVVGTDVANRTSVETEHLIGFFVNVLALRIKIQKNMNFQEMLQDVRKTVLDAYAHQEIPFEMVIDQVTLTREDLNVPLIRVLFVLQNFSSDAREKLPGITIESLRSEKPPARFDLTLFLQEGPEGIGGSVVYRAALFREQTIASLVRRLQLLLENAVARPDIPVEKLEMLTAEEKAEQKNEKEERSREALRLLLRRKRKAIDVSESHSEISERRSR